MLFQWNGGAEQQFAGTCFSRVAVKLGELHFKFRHTHAIVFAHFRHRIDTIAFFLDGPEFLMSHDDGIKNRKFLVAELILLEHRHADIGQQGDRA